MSALRGSSNRSESSLLEAGAGLLAFFFEGFDEDFLTEVVADEKRSSENKRLTLKKRCNEKYKTTSFAGLLVPK